MQVNSLPTETDILRKQQEAVRVVLMQHNRFKPPDAAPEVGYDRAIYRVRCDECDEICWLPRGRGYCDDCHSLNELERELNMKTFRMEREARMRELEEQLRG